MLHGVIFNATCLAASVRQAAPARGIALPNIPWNGQNRCETSSI